jgi:hypothetical protein
MEFGEIIYLHAIGRTSTPDLQSTLDAVINRGNDTKGPCILWDQLVVPCRLKILISGSVVAS